MAAVGTEADLPTLNIGTVGHVDHGKTTLTAALTKKGGQGKSYDEIDNAPEEKARGITIKSACVEYCTKNRRITHQDCPGHADFIKNCITSMAQIDALILVISATDGVMPQTKEHLLLAKQLGITHIIVYINKVDALDKAEREDLIEMIVDDVQTLAGKNSGLGFTIQEVVTGSALCALEDKDPELGAKSIETLFEAIDKLPLPEDKKNLPFRMNVEGVCNIPGRGTVVTGRICDGQIKIGDSLDIIGLGKDKSGLVITGIERFHKQHPTAASGDNVGILLRGLNKDDVRRGVTLVKSGSGLKAAQTFKAEFLCVKEEDGGRAKPFTKRFTPQLHIGTADITAVELEFPDGVELVNPGEHLTIKIKIQYPIYLHVGQKFSVRESGKTIASGTLTEVL